MLRLKSLRLLLTLEEEGPLCELRAARVQALKLELADLLLPEDLMACARSSGRAEPMRTWRTRCLRQRSGARRRSVKRACARG